ncbi:hypothetical protein BUQ74_11810 [Leptospira weilii serovar Heyan]|nr:hypothetical protein BUQ74_11810 [Leptospira weilii serovar Heyan]
MNSISLSKGREIGGKLGRFLSIRKSYFLQVKSIILVGTLEKYQLLILIIPKAFLTCGARNIIITSVLLIPIK